MNPKLKIFIFCTLLSLYHTTKTVEKFSNLNQESALNTHFDQIYVITLPERKMYVQNILEKYNIAANYIPAITELPRNHIAYDDKTKISKARILCHISHIEVLKKFIKSKEKTCFIFEDDIHMKINPNILNQEIKKVMNVMNKINYDIVFMGYCWENCSKRIPVNESIMKPHFPKCRHAYGVTKQGAEKIIKYTTPLKNLPGDKTLALAIKNGKLNAFATKEPLFWQNRKKLGSTLDNYDSLKVCRD